MIKRLGQALSLSEFVFHDFLNDWNVPMIHFIHYISGNE